MNKDILSDIAKIGREYYTSKIIMKDINNKELFTKDWYEALKFFFGKTFYQGRRDTISTNFLNKTIETLDSCLSSSSEGKMARRMWS